MSLFGQIDLQGAGESLNLDEAHPPGDWIGVIDFVGLTSVSNSIVMRFGLTARISDFGMKVAARTR